MLPLLLLLAAQPMPARMYWMWEFSADLRQRNLQGAGVAFLLAAAESQGQRLIWRLRRQPLQLAPGTPRMAVIRLTVHPREAPRNIDLRKEKLASKIAAFATQARVPALQIDADIDPGQAEAYLTLLADVRRLLPSTFLSVTANTSWCRPGSWLDHAPVDEVVPMFFVRGAAGERTNAEQLSARCRPSVGLVPGMPPPAQWTRQRIYHFVIQPWDFTAKFPD
jgi:hypothetical protein